MLGSCELNWIMGKWHSDHVITVDCGGGSWIRSSLKIVCIRKISAAVAAGLQYSASALDQATMVCFLAHQETKFGPKYMHEPEVERMSSGSEAQSASEKPVNISKEADAGWRCNPCVTVPLRYAFYCCPVGFKRPRHELIDLVNNIRYFRPCDGSIL